MLMQFGAVQFAVAPMNAHELDQATGGSFAKHPVLGRMPVQEFVGESEETFEIKGKLYPQKFGGLSELETLRAMSRSGSAYFLMRGDGVPMGWFTIHSVKVHSTYLDAGGVGRVQEFSGHLERSDAPSADGIFAALVGLFA